MNTRAGSDIATEGTYCPTSEVFKAGVEEQVRDGYRASALAKDGDLKRLQFYSLAADSGVGGEHTLVGSPPKELI